MISWTPKSPPGPETKYFKGSALGLFGFGIGGLIVFLAGLVAIDLFPTILSLTNSQVPVSWELDGEDISKAIYGEKVDRQRSVYWEYGGNIHNIRPGKDEHISPTNAMRDGDWKCLVNDDGSELKLFKLTSDPGEATNLVTEYPERAESMRSKIMEWRQTL